MADVQLSTLGGVIKTAYEGELDTNAFTDAEKAKLAGLENGAQVNQTDAEIKTQYENNADTNAFTDAEQTKLAGIAANATVGMIVQDEGSLLDADATALNFVGAGVVATDAGSGVITVTITGGGGGGSIPTQDDGIEIVAAPTAHNFTGAGVTVTDVGGVATINIPGGGGGSAIEVEDEGISLTTNVTKFNFVGAGVTATEPVADEITVTIPGGGTPGGADTQIQFNNAGAFGGSANLTWNGTALDVTGNITVSGTVDGRDVATDGTKLDGIATGATAGVITQDEGIQVDAAATTLNFVGTGVTATDAGSNVTTVTIPGGGGAIPTQDDGVEIVAAPTAHNFTGAGVTVTDVGGVATIDIPGIVGGGDGYTETVIYSQDWSVGGPYTTTGALDISGYDEVYWQIFDNTGGTPFLKLSTDGVTFRDAEDDYFQAFGSASSSGFTGNAAGTGIAVGSDWAYGTLRHFGNSNVRTAGRLHRASSTTSNTDATIWSSAEVVDTHIQIDTSTSWTAGTIKIVGITYAQPPTVTGTQVVETFVDTVTGPTWSIPIPTDNVVAWELHVESPSTTNGTNIGIRINGNSTNSYNSYRGNLYDTNSQAVAGATGSNILLTLRSSADAANQPVRLQLRGSQPNSDSNVDMSGIAYAGANDQFWTSFGATYTNPSNEATSSIQMFAAFGDAIPATPVEYRLTVWRDVNSAIESTPASSFRATQSVAQNLPESSFGPVEFDTTEHDTTNGYNNTTDTYTVPADLDGRYMSFNANLRSAGVGTLYIQVNGTNIVQHGSTNGRFSCNTGPRLMTAGDTVTVQYFGTGGNTVIEACSFSGYVILGLVGSGGQGGGISGVAVQEEGVEAIATATALNFVGGLVTATNAGGGVADITIGDTLTSFSDFPAGYAGQGTKLLRVNAIEDAVEFVDDRLPVPTTGDASKVLTVNLTEDGYELVAESPAGIETQDDGAQIVAASTTLNFTGPGVTVTDAGSNVSTVNIPTAVVSDFANNWSVPWRGATAILLANDTAVDLSAFTIYDWDSIDNDTDSFWSAGQPSRLTIPVGENITKIRLHAFLDISADLTTTDNMWFSFYKNGSTSFRASGNAACRPGFSNQVPSISSGVIDVVDSDYFEFVVQVAGLLNATIESSRSYFQLEVVEVANATSRVYEVPGTILGVPTSSQILSQQVLTRPATLLAGGGQSAGYTNTTATALTNFSITRNGVQVGTVDFAIASNTATFTIASDVNFVAGDRIAVVAPATPDATLADVSITLDLNLFE